MTHSPACCGSTRPSTLEIIQSFPEEVMLKLRLKEVEVGQEAIHQEHHVFQGSKVKGKHQIQGLRGLPIRLEGELGRKVQKDGVRS